MTLDELLATLDRQLAVTWAREREPPGDAMEVAGPAPAAPGSAGPVAPPPLEPVPAAPEVQEAAGERCLLVSLPGRRYAVPTRAVTAVAELPPVSAVPFAPPWLRGLARAAGVVVAVVDLARLLAPATGSAPASPAAPAAPAAPSAWSSAPGGAGSGAPGMAEDTAAGDPAVHETLLVVRTADASLDAGLVVRGIARLATLPGAPGRPPAAGELAAGPAAALVAGLVADPRGAALAPVAVLDVDRLLRGAHEELCA